MQKRFRRRVRSALLLPLLGTPAFADPIIQQGFESYPLAGPSAPPFGSNATTEGRWFSTEVDLDHNGVFAITNAQAHSGTQSLFADRPSGAWSTAIGGSRFDGTPTGSAAIDTTVPGTKFDASLWVRRAADASTVVFLTSMFQPIDNEFITGVYLPSNGEVQYIKPDFSGWTSTNNVSEVAPDTWTRLRMSYDIVSAGAGTLSLYVMTDSVAEHLVGTREFTGLPSLIRAFDINPSTGAFYYDDAVLGTSELLSKWANNSSGDWNVTTNWANNTVPNAPDAQAFFLSTITAPKTVYTDVPVTIGSATFDNSNSYVIAGSASLTLQTSTGTAQINVLNGNHKINLPFTIASDATFAIAPGTSLTLGNPTTIAANKSVSVTGGGSLLIQAPLSIGAGGTLALGAAPATLFSAPTLASGAKINVGTQAITIDYRGQASPAATIRAQLASGFAGGTWTGEGIMTSEGSTSRALGWKDDPASQSILIKYTVLGDADLSGAVDSVDFAALATSFNSSSKVWVNGDFNYDGIVNALDFNALASNFGQSLPSPALGAVVPEPFGGAALMLGGLLGLVGRRKSQKH
jgi:hypothetical protein